MRDLRFMKFVLFVNGLVPGSLLLWDACRGHAGANPVNYAIRTTGLLALIFLSLSLLVTPLRKITGVSWLFHFRRLLGLFAFFYALAHFGIFFVLDRTLHVRGTLSEMVKRPYLAVGAAALLVMVPLAATSTNDMIKRMGPARWRALHRLAYVAAIAGVVHFYMLVKSDIRLPVAFGAALAILLGYRLVTSLRGWSKKISRRSAASAAAASSDAGRWSGQLRVDRIVQETPGVKTFRLVPPAGGALPFAYLPGQYLTFTLPIGGKTVRRSYTIASTPTRDGYCEVTVKREEQGLGSRYLHDVVAEGHLLSVSAPAGRFTFSGAESGRIALVAAGVGITPLMSILRSLADRNWAGAIYLVYSNRTATDIIFREEIAALQRRHPNIRAVLTLTRADDASWTGATGRIDAALLTREIPDVKSIPFYLCGPAEMLAGTRTVLRRMGVAESSIHVESFGSAGAGPTGTSASPVTGGPFTVTFSRSQRSVSTQIARPLLALAEELGIEVDSECRSGICGRCKCHLLSGSVEMATQDALSAADRRDNIILLCQSWALEDVTVEA